MSRKSKWTAIWAFTAVYAVCLIVFCVIMSIAPSGPLDKMMQHPLFPIQFFKWPLVVTGWKLLGGIGTFLFAGRWLVQAYYARRAGKPVTPLMFWVLSLVGSNLTLIYFIYSPKQDMVGVLGNFVPSFVAVYNLYLEIRNRSKAALEAARESGVQKVKKEEKRDDPPDMPRLAKSPLPIIQVATQEPAAGE